jgi:hypothetical protein
MSFWRNSAPEMRIKCMCVMSGRACERRLASPVEEDSLRLRNAKFSRSSGSLVGISMISLMGQRSAGVVELAVNVPTDSDGLARLQENWLIHEDDADSRAIHSSSSSGKQA